MYGKGFVLTLGRSKESTIPKVRYYFSVFQKTLLVILFRIFLTHKKARRSIDRNTNKNIFY